MSLRTILPRVVLAAAAAASIATSQLWWTLEEMALLEPVALEDRAPTSAYAIQATVETPYRGCADSNGEMTVCGDLQVSFDLSVRDVTGVLSAQVEVELRSLTNDSEGVSQLFTVGPGAPTTGHLSVSAWSECASGSCTEDFTLTLRRRPASGDPVVEVTGSVRARTQGPESSEPPAGARIALDVTNLGPVP